MHLNIATRMTVAVVTHAATPTHRPAWTRQWLVIPGVGWKAGKSGLTYTTMKVNRAANPEANKHTGGSVSFATHQSRLEKELKQPPTFSEVFDKTQKKKGTEQYISDRAREVADSCNQQMTEKYAGEEQPQLDPECPKERPCVWFWAQYGHKQGVIRRLEFNLIGD
ncbi:hypothetical protein Taro_001037 [Colocasia esculenta]|uniref:Uncharacterized protein n=1 Tax=Colocasia esculenta TaxID=4460 RepID=A0A843TF44_COLES|nr:hypothetical protein [Colocasia esculenta]